jgi:hypothetical protein
MWGSEPYRGLGYDWDPDWMLTERHKQLRATLIELCQQEMHTNAKGKRALAEKLLAQAADDAAKEPIAR